MRVIGTGAPRGPVYHGDPARGVQRRRRLRASAGLFRPSLPSTTPSVGRRVGSAPRGSEHARPSPPEGQDLARRRRPAPPGRWPRRASPSALDAPRLGSTPATCRSPPHPARELTSIGLWLDRPRGLIALACALGPCAAAGAGSAGGWPGCGAGLAAGRGCGEPCGKRGSRHLLRTRLMFTSPCGRFLRVSPFAVTQLVFSSPLRDGITAHGRASPPTGGTTAHG